MKHLEIRAMIRRINLLEIISTIQADKINRKVIPDHALYYEIIEIAKEKGYSKQEVIDELNRLEISEKIKVGRTINQQYIVTT